MASELLVETIGQGLSAAIAHKVAAVASSRRARRAVAMATGIVARMAQDRGQVAAVANLVVDISAGAAG